MTRGDRFPAERDERFSLPGVVFDCNLFLQALASDAGPVFACLKLVEMKNVDLYLSRDILAEVQDVLARPAIQRKFPNLTPERVNTFLSRLVASAIMVSDVPTTFRYSRDPEDEPYINLALVSGARYLVSRDRDLLDLGRADREFKARYPDLNILDPVAFLTVMRDGGD